jgi:uncharacterized protein (DUF4415 family)
LPWIAALRPNAILNVGWSAFDLDLTLGLHDRLRKNYDFSKAQRGAVIPSKGNTRITIMLDDDVLGYFLAKAEGEGSGYQAMINAALRKYLDQSKRKTAESKPLTVAVLREELRLRVNSP